MITVTGCEVFPDNGRAPDLYSIGYGLARTARFAGQTKIWYSVLAHVHSVSSIVSPENKIHALLHDAAESIVGDQVSTWKNKETKADENLILALIYRDLTEDLDIEYPPEMPEEVAMADAACLAAEALLLGHNAPNHPHFTAIREAEPFLYQRALDLTEWNISKFTHEYCIGDTDGAAKEFQSLALELCNGVKI